MKKYKISKKNLKEFFGFIGKKKTPVELQKVVDNDPVLQKLQKDFRDLNDKSKEYWDKQKNKNPERYRMFQKHGLVPKD